MRLETHVNDVIVLARGKPKWHLLKWYQFNTIWNAQNFNCRKLVHEDFHFSYMQFPSFDKHPASLQMNISLCLFVTYILFESLSKNLMNNQRKLMIPSYNLVDIVNDTHNSVFSLHILASYYLQHQPSIWRHCIQFELGNEKFFIKY